MKTYTIIGGVNGTGKSSLTGVLKAETKDLGTIIDVDKLNIEYGSALAGGKAAVLKIQDCINKGLSFTQETTLSGRKTAITAKKAQESGYFVRLYYVGISSVEESISRIANRVQKGGHDIPSSDVHRRYQSRYEDLLAVLPFCNEAIFYDNENGFQVIAEYRSGKFFLLSDQTPEWFIPLRNRLIN